MDHFMGRLNVPVHLLYMVHLFRANETLQALATLFGEDYVTIDYQYMHVSTTSSIVLSDVVVDGL
jgi:hypothetical protein